MNPGGQERSDSGRSAGGQERSDSGRSAGGQERSDPLAPLAELPGVAEAGEQAREALARAHRHRTNLRGWPTTAAEAALRAARSSSVLDGGGLELDLAAEKMTDDPVLAGALRVAQAIEGGETNLVGVWRRAPLQALARLHMLAAADLVGEDRLGRPRPDAEVGERLELLADLLTGGTRVTAPVLAGVVHGELLTLAPFGSADGVVARAAARLVTMTTGLDPHGLGVPEVSWMRHPDEYRTAADGFASGTAEGLARWLLMSCQALQSGAREAMSIAEAGAS